MRWLDRLTARGPPKAIGPTLADRLSAAYDAAARGDYPAALDEIAEAEGRARAPLSEAGP